MRLGKPTKMSIRQSANSFNLLNNLIRYEQQKQVIRDLIARPVNEVINLRINEFR